MYKVLLIRHSITKGNLEKRYISITDEALCKEGIKLAKIKNIENEHLFEDVEMVFSSPLKRCIQTANLLFECMDINIMEELKEMDFGDFEYMNYEELNGNEYYQKWIDNGAKAGFPNGEDFEKFRQRSLNGFFEAFNMAMYEKKRKLALVTHGGIIMSVMDILTGSVRDYYDWQVKNCEGYELEFDENGILKEYNAF